MISQELIKRMSNRLDLFHEKEIERSVRTIVNAFSDTLAEDERIEIRGFGSFFLKEYASRKAINPRMGNQVDLGARKIPQFRISKGLHLRLNPEKKS